VALVPFGSVDTSVLRWIRTAERPAGFTLGAGDAELATLTWEDTGGSSATARTAGTSWTFRRAGFLRPTILVHEPGRSEPIARVSARLARHEITIAGAPQFRLRHVSHVVPSWRVTTDRGQEVLHLEPVAEKRSLQAGAVIVSSTEAGPATLLLVVLSWYFVVLNWFEDETIEALAPYEGPDPPLERGSSD